MLACCAVLKARGGAVSTISGGFGEGETPLPIPNRAVKPLSADGTWPSRAWESRSPPVYLHEPPSGGSWCLRARSGPANHGSDCAAGRSRPGATWCVGGPPGPARAWAVPPAAHGRGEEDGEEGGRRWAARRPAHRCVGVLLPARGRAARHAAASCRGPAPWRPWAGAGGAEAAWPRATRGGPRRRDPGWPRAPREAAR